MTADHWWLLLGLGVVALAFAILAIGAIWGGAEERERRRAKREDDDD